MPRNYETDYAWQAQYKPAVSRLIVVFLGVPLSDIEFTSPESEDDRKHNTDIFIKYEGRIQRVSQRLRRYVVAEDFTLRYERPESLSEWWKVLVRLRRSFPVRARPT